MSSMVRRSVMVAVMMMVVTGAQSQQAERCNDGDSEFVVHDEMMFD